MSSNWVFLLGIRLLSKKSTDLSVRNKVLPQINEENTPKIQKKTLKNC